MVTDAGKRLEIVKRKGFVLIALHHTRCLNVNQNNHAKHVNADTTVASVMPISKDKTSMSTDTNQSGTVTAIGT